VPSIDVPSIDVPSIDVPSIDVPSIDVVERGSGRPGPAGRWHIEYRQGSAEELHCCSAALVGAAPVTAPQAAGGGGDDAEAAPGGVAPRVRLLSVERPALVLGSGQPVADVDTEAAAASGVDVVRRRSGGGAVLVEPDGILWVDVIVPEGDPLWQADISRAAWWVGAVWASALEAAVGARPEIWHGPMRRNAWSARVCFAGLGPGEVRIDGKKVVGVSQRRTRTAALFQTAALLRWDPAALLALLRADAGGRGEAAADLAMVAVGVGPEHAGPLIDGFLAALP
jgi:lipoate-protein ligase A